MILAVEGGGTKTRAGLYSESGELLAETEAGPANPAAYGVDAVMGALSAVARGLVGDRAGTLTICAGLAGAGLADVREAVAAALGAATGAERVVVTTDLHPVLFANAGPGSGVLVIAGTGSGVLAKNRHGRVLKVGARGAVFGDDGGAYRVAVEGLRAAAAMRDGLGPDTSLVDLLPPAAGLRDFDEFAVWTGGAGKREVAALARVVSAAAEAGDFVARACLDDQARRLAAQAVAAVERMELGAGARLFLHGALIEQCGHFRKAFCESVDQYLETQFMDCTLGGHAAVHECFRRETPAGDWFFEWQKGGGGVVESLPPTERRMAGEKTLDTMDALGIVRFMNRLDAALPSVVAREEESIAAAVSAAAAALGRGGRIVYFGAGTSGRLGVLDASECPPTFGVDADRVIGLIAGGDAALRSSIEGEEDNRDAGAAEVAGIGAGPLDVVVGIAASGGTPYVGGALEEAKRRGAMTVLLCCNPSPAIEADIMICLATGPEALTGSTRLKAGTATKMVLNMISTGAMALSGYVHRGLMVEMRPTNAKLRRRAARMVDALTGVGGPAAEALLADAGWSIPVAVVMAAFSCGADEAREKLRPHGGHLGGIFGK